MKKLFNLMSILLMLSLIVFASCSEDDPAVDEPPVEDTPAQAQAKLIVADGATWSLAATDPVTVDGTPSTDWAGFTLQFGGNEDGGTFTTANSASPIVWPTTGTWTFADGSVTQMNRNDGVTMTVNVTETDMTLSFEVEDPGSGRTLGFGGSWIFKVGNQ